MNSEEGLDMLLNMSADVYLCLQQGKKFEVQLLTPWCKQLEQMFNDILNHSCLNDQNIHHHFLTVHIWHDTAMMLCLKNIYSHLHGVSCSLRPCLDTVHDGE